MDTEQLKKVLARARIVPELTDLLPQGTEFFLTGGALRDFCLGREMTDFDFAGPFDPTALARTFAAHAGGHWFPLDQVRRQSRVVVRQGDEAVTYDFAPYRGPNLEADLRLRDFTVNALALPLPAGGDIVDPLGGLEDLRARRLRECSADVFLDDPLRVLKGVRHAVILGFEIEPATVARMRQAAPFLRRVAPERIRAEAGKIFAAAPVAAAILLLQDLHIASVLFGPCAHGGSAGGGTALAARMEGVLSAAGGDPATAHLAAEEFEAGLSRGALLKLAAFLRGWQPPDTGLAVAHLRLGRRATAVVRHLLDLHPGKGTEADRLPDLDRSRALWGAEAGGSIPDTLLFLALLRPESPTEAFTRMQPVLRDWLRLARDGRVPDLVDGNWAREHLRLPEGPELGEVLCALRREEIAGRVRTPEEARDFLLRCEKND